MKKPNRISGNGDSKRPRAQSKATRRRTAAARSKPASESTAARAAVPEPSPGNAEYGEEIACRDEITPYGAQSLHRRGKEYTLVTEGNEVRAGRHWRTWEEWSARNPGIAPWELPPGKVRRGKSAESLTREQAVAWLYENLCSIIVPPEFQADFRPGGPGVDRGLIPREPADELSQINLAELLDGDTRQALFKLAGDGLPLKKQIAGAVHSWVAFAEHFDTWEDGRRRIAEAPGVLAPEQFEFTVAWERSRFISAPGAKFFRSLVARGKEMPLAEAADYFGLLADLIEFHPALVDEHKSLHELRDAACLLGRSSALTALLGEPRETAGGAR